MRIMGLDYGSVTVGVALTDELLMISQPVETIRRKSENKLRRTLARIEELVSENDVGLIVVGLPLNMDDTAGERAVKATEFAEMLKRRTGLQVVMQDERLSTETAKETLYEAGVKGKDLKQYVDKVAASYILQDYLNGREQNNTDK